MRGEEKEPAARVELSIGRITRGAIVVIALWGLANLVWLGRDVFFLAFFALLFAVFLSLFVDRLERAGLRRGIGTLIVLLALAAVLGGFGYLVWPSLADQIGLVRRRVPEMLESAEAWLRPLLAQLAPAQTPGQDAQPMTDRVGEALLGQASQLFGGALPLLNTVFGVVLGIFIVIFAGAYMAVNPRTYAAGAEHLIPPRLRGRIIDAASASIDNLKRWMLGQAVAMTIIGTLSTLGLWLLDVPAPLALGVLAGLLQFIPTYGPLISAIPAAGMALLVSPATVLYVLALYAGIQFVESNFITPLVMRETAALPPALTLLFQALMGILFGFLGLLLAVPILAAGLVLVRELYVRPLERAERTP